MTEISYLYIGFLFVFASLKLVGYAYFTNISRMTASDSQLVDVYCGDLNNTVEELSRFTVV